MWINPGKKKEFRKNFLEATGYDPRISENTASDICDAGIGDKVIDAFKNYSPEKAVEELNKEGNGRNTPGKDYEFTISEKVGRRYINFHNY